MFESNSQLAAWILSRTGAETILESFVIQELWGGYGELLRIRLSGAPVGSVILKRVVPPPQAGETFSDRRKRRSYEVERNWYEHGAPYCDDTCRVARCLGTSQTHSLLLLEDLGDSGFRPISLPDSEQVKAGLGWLASFHARFLEAPPPGLWEQGRYWHLETRQLEWSQMPPGLHKKYASALDSCLKATRFKTLVHGDPKPANYCWSEGGEVAAVDFQYVGGGCGVTDVALFLDRGLGRQRCRAEESDWLNQYFAMLRTALERDEKVLDFPALEADWRARFPVAWSDYARFALGWADSYKLDEYSLELMERAVAFCESQSATPSR